MSEALQRLNHRFHSAVELKSVVRTMKTLAAVSIGPYEEAVGALTDYYRTVELGLIASLNHAANTSTENHSDRAQGITGAVVFGSDQGMVGEFNEILADFLTNDLKVLEGKKVVWPIGERITWGLTSPDIDLMPTHPMPDTVAGITPLTSQILQEIDFHRKERGLGQVLIFHNRPSEGKRYEPSRLRLLPFDSEWLKEVASKKWPTRMIPEVLPTKGQTVAALLGEYLFVSLFRSCAESLAAENASRLASMQSAERKAGDLIEHLRFDLNQERQNSIDEELFDVVTGYEALSS